MQKHDIAAIFTVCLTILGFVSSADQGNAPHLMLGSGGVSSGNSLKNLPATSQSSVGDEEYFDCLADIPNECSNVQIPDASGCSQWQACAEVCKIEGGEHSCVTQCDIDYLEIKSCSLETNSCSCDICLKICDEDCSCGT